LKAFVGTGDLNRRSPDIRLKFTLSEIRCDADRDLLYEARISS
jgi:hypothetical protein